ncbi:MAG: pitrilysin family protein, partial [Hyphomicrobium sp.]|jgi:zinc protease
MIIQEVTSPGGIQAWLVEDYALPMFTLYYGFEGGGAQDPAGKEGLTNFVTLALDKGTRALQRRAEELALRLSFHATTDTIFGGVEALSENRDAASQLLKRALTHPRFDADAIEDVRRRLLSFHAGEARMPWFVARVQWDAVAFAGHPYARQIAGTEATIPVITAADIRAYTARVFARDRLKVVAVGDIIPAELGKFLDDAFGELPASANLTPVPAITPVLGGRLRVADMDVSQSGVQFGVGAVPYDDPDYVAAEVLTHIVGGSGIASKLADEVRVKRGLAFSIETWLERFGNAAVFRGTVYTHNDKVAQSLDIINEVLRKIWDGALTQADLEDAQGYLIASYPLRFDSYPNIADELLGLFMAGFGPEFFENRKRLIAAVTLDDLKRVAKRMLDPKDLIVSIAGSPALQPPRTD